MSLTVTSVTTSLDSSTQTPLLPVSLQPLASNLAAFIQEHPKNPTQKIPVVGVGGCPGVGKTTMTNLLAEQLQREGLSCIVVHFDDWTNPQEARDDGYFNLTGVHEFFAAVLNGQTVIGKPVVNEFTDEHSREVVDLREIDFIFFEGLLTLSEKDPQMNYFQYCDRGVFLEADEKDITQWKRNRPVSMQRTDEEFAQHMKAVFAFHHENIEPFKPNASWVVHKNADHDYSLM